MGRCHFCGVIHIGFLRLGVADRRTPTVAKATHDVIVRATITFCVIISFFFDGNPIRWDDFFFLFPFCWLLRAVSHHDHQSTVLLVSHIIRAVLF
jgi:hypothetical protein